MAVLVTRPAGAGDPLVAEPESRGYRVISVPTGSVRPGEGRLPGLGWVDRVRLDRPDQRRGRGSPAEHTVRTSVGRGRRIDRGGPAQEGSGGRSGPCRVEWSRTWRVASRPRRSSCPAGAGFAGGSGPAGDAA